MNMLHHYSRHILSSLRRRRIIIFSRILFQASIVSLKKNCSISKMYKDNTKTTLQYCEQNSIRPGPHEIKIREETLKRGDSFYMGCQDVFQMGQNLIRLIRGKRILDVGVYTGASSLAWALAIPEDGEVISMDIRDHSDAAFKEVGEPIIKDAGVRHKIHLKIQQATNSLDELIAGNQSGTFDFAFIDADKGNYPAYYEKCLKLLRPGGVIAIDNAFRWGTIFVHPSRMEEEAKITDELNKKIHADSRVDCNLLPIGDGLMLAFKKHAS